MSDVQRTDLIALLARGHTYLWALRHAHAHEEELTNARDALLAAGIGLEELTALRAIERSIAQFPHPTSRRPDHLYLEVPIPPDMQVFLAPVITELGVEVGTELFPMRINWTFAHRETQYCTGGQTHLDAVLPHNAVESREFGVGDVMAIPAGTRLTFHSSEEGERFGHAHIYFLNLPGGEPQTYYDAVSLLRLRQRGVVPSPTPMPPLHDVRSRIEVLDWSALVSPRPNRTSQLPTWLRNGWEHREATRALDYHEGTKALVINSPDREPAEYLPWGDGDTRCWINPLIAEHTCAVTDCRFPAGYFRLHASTELWTVLRGGATVRQTLPPLHDEEHIADVSSGAVLVVPGGARVFVDEASSDLVVRRLAASGACNGHSAMMERKLIADGVAPRA